MDGENFERFAYREPGGKFQSAEPIDKFGLANRVPPTEGQGLLTPDISFVSPRCIQSESKAKRFAPVHHFVDWF